VQTSSLRSSSAPAVASVRALDDEAPPASSLAAFVEDLVARVRPKVQRLWRYAVTSVAATVVSEVVLVVLYAGRVTGATTAAVIASLAAAVPSYFMSRFWIWPEADRDHRTRQVTLYFVVSVISLVVSSVLTGLAGHVARGTHLKHVIIVALTYIGTYVLLWLAKFVVYQRVLFRSTAPAAVAAEAA